MIRFVTISLVLLLFIVGFYLFLPSNPSPSAPTQKVPTSSLNQRIDPTPHKGYSLLVEAGLPKGIDVEILDKDCFLVGYYEPAEQAACIWNGIINFMLMSG